MIKALTIVRNHTNIQKYDFGRLEDKMNIKYSNIIHKINYLSSELASVYHNSSVKFGISDSVSVVLYSILDAGNECLLSDIYKTSGISKQTINSAIRNLEARDIVVLRQIDGRSKKVAFTDKGREYAKATVERLYNAEGKAFESWSEEEIQQYISLMEKYVDTFRAEIEKL